MSAHIDSTTRATDAFADAPQPAGIERSGLERQQREAAARQTDLISQFSRQIRAPLTAISNAAERLEKSDDLQPTDDELVATLSAETATLRTLIDDMLDLSKLCSGQMELTNDVFSPATVVDEVGRGFGLACASKGLEFAIRVDASIPSKLKGDASRLRQILANLVSNAVHHTTEGFVRLEASQNIDGSVRFRVSDSGPGIPRAARATLFDPFAVLASDASDFGLGLTITKRLVELMDGALGFETGEHGTSFWCDITFGHARRASDHRPSAPPTLIKAPSAARILIVDDSEVNRLLASSQLDRLGYISSTAQSGEEALERLRSEAFDAVLMDWHMPGLDGLEATRQWRSTEAGPPLPIITMTASAMTGDRERCLDAGASDYLSKPVSITDLGATLSRWTRSNDALPERAAPSSFDTDQIKALIDDLGDVDVVCQILDAFLEMVPQYRTSARDGLANGDIAAVRRCAHTLKSTAAMLGANELADACAALEQSASNQSERLPGLVETFDHRCEEAAADLAVLATSLRAEVSVL